MPPAEFDVAVVGGGIAGLTAALTCARLGRKTVMLSGEMLGGQLVNIGKIDGYPGFPDGVAGYELCPSVQEQAVAAGAFCTSARLERLAAEERGWMLAADTGAFVAGAVVLATGASLKDLGVPGEARLRGRGVSHCASCEGPLLRNKVVVVVGGGDSAAQEALVLAEFASRVVLLLRGGALHAQAVYRDAVARHPRIELRVHTAVEEVLGDAAVCGVRTRHTVTGGTSDVDAAGVFIYAGLQANAACVAGLVALDAAGCVPVDAALRTALPGVWAVGAVRSGWPGRAVAAAGDGAAAALGVDAFLNDRLAVGVRHD